MTDAKTVTACVLIIGNEVLSGRTPDANLHWLAERLTETGIRLAEARVIPDVEEVIVHVVNETRAKYDYVFTTGGIGPTHDDITAGCIAKAFGTTLYRHPDAVAALEARLGDKLNDARLKMAEVPEGATLLTNPVSAAPGFQVGNVYVMAGVPSIMRAMFETLQPTLMGGPKLMSKTVVAYLPEGAIAKGLGEIQARHPETDIGSYPFFKAGRFGCSLVTRATEEGELDTAVEEIRDLVRALGAEPADETGEELPPG